MQEKTEDEATWRRRLGSAANNRGWSLAEQPSRTPAEDQEMLHAAHASVHLWSTIGTERNLALGHLLLGQVHALLGHAQTAAQYAKAAHAYFTGNDSAPWELAFAYAVRAHADYRNGDLPGHAAGYRRAQEVIDGLADAEEREILLATLRVIPAPDGVAGPG